MTLIRFEPLKELESFSNRIQRYFEDFPSFDFQTSFNPRVDISEDEKHVIVEAEVPGIKKDELKLTLHDNILTIKGEKRKQEEKKDKNYFRSERYYGSFQRSFTLPEEVDSNKVETKFEDGTLTIRMEKIAPKPSNIKEIELK